MRAIDKALVDEVWRELTAYAPARVASEAQAFLDLQPHAAAFSQSLTRQFDPTVQKAALGLAFLLFKVLEASLGRPFPELAWPRTSSRSSTRAARCRGSMTRRCGRASTACSRR